MIMETSSVRIPHKSLFKLSEVCELTGIKPYVLRFWESEFAAIAPILSESGQKLYEPKDIEAIERIKGLLFEQKLSVPNAKAKLEELLQSGPIEMTYATDDLKVTAKFS